MDDIRNCENIKMGAIMPLIGHIMCFMRQQISQTYMALGYDIAPEAAQALMIIQHFDGLPQTKLADILGKDKASITRLLNSLVKADLVERIQDQADRRIIRAHITEAGAKVFESFIPKLHSLSDMALQGVSDSDFATTVRTLNQIVANTHPECPNRNKS